MANFAKIVCWSFVLSAFLQGSQEVDLDGTCDGTNTCSTQDAECIATKCSCKSGFKKEGSACKKAINSNCGNVNECVTNTVCETTCKCKEGYTADADGLCKKGIDLTTVTCTRDGNQCTVLNSECDNAANGPKCKCSAGYKLNTSKDGCLKVIGGVCANAADCTTPDPNANCTGDHAKTCTCKANYTEKNNVCTLMVSSKPCTGTTCPGTANAECANLKCQCSEGFTETADTCSKNAESTAASVGVSMSALSVCLLAGLKKVF